VHRNLCAGGKRNEVSNFGGGSGGKDLWEGDGAAKVELTYSTTRNINRARPAFGTLVVCIIQGILYFFHGAVAAVVSHGLAKERAVRPKEIDRAVERKRRFEANPSKHTYEEA